MGKGKEMVEGVQGEENGMEKGLKYVTYIYQLYTRNVNMCCKYVLIKARIKRISKLLTFNRKCHNTSYETEYKE